jgi:hypothetical protein
VVGRWVELARVSGVVRVMCGGCTLRGDGEGGRLGEGVRDVGIEDVGTRDV